VFIIVISSLMMCFDKSLYRITSKPYFLELKGMIHEGTGKSYDGF